MDGQRNELLDSPYVPEEQFKAFITPMIDVTDSNATGKREYVPGRPIPVDAIGLTEMLKRLDVYPHSGYGELNIHIEAGRITLFELTTKIKK